jgi:hypothetical protein
MGALHWIRCLYYRGASSRRQGVEGLCFDGKGWASRSSDFFDTRGPLELLVSWTIAI